jgi:hypothetical protein
MKEKTLDEGGGNAIEQFIWLGWAYFWKCTETAENERARSLTINEGIRRL